MHHGVTAVHGLDGLAEFIQIGFLELANSFSGGRNINVVHGVSGIEKLFDGGATGLTRSACDCDGVHDVTLILEETT